MSVRKRTWITSNEEERTRWLVDYRDGAGKRRTKQFARKKDADAFRDRAAHEVREGIHVADRETVTVAKAGDMWLEAGKAQGLERTTLDVRRQHFERHMKPFIGAMKLNKLTVPAIYGFQDRLRAEGRSPDMIRRVTVSLGGILKNAVARGKAAQNAVASMPRDSGVQKRHKKELEVGVDIPTPDEIRRLIAVLPGNRYRPLLLTAIFTGLRASELRGLRWADVDFAENQIHVRQRVDCYNEAGPPKSHAGRRKVPLFPMVANTLKQLKLATGGNGFVFPTGKGRPEYTGNIVRRGLQPAMIAAGIVAADGKPKYTGLHALRHFYASWCINRKIDGGLELSPQLVQQRLGHEDITTTMNIYSHLFPSQTDSEELAAAEAALLGAT